MPHCSRHASNSVGVGFSELPSRLVNSCPLSVCTHSNLTNVKAAEEFIKEYVDGNFDEMDIPEPYADFRDEDEFFDDEEKN